MAFTYWFASLGLIPTVLISTFSFTIILLRLLTAQIFSNLATRKSTELYYLIVPSTVLPLTFSLLMPELSHVLLDNSEAHKLYAKCQMTNNMARVAAGTTDGIGRVYNVYTP